MEIMKHHFTDVWTSDGKILFKDVNDNKIKSLSCIFNDMINLSYYEH